MEHVCGFFQFHCRGTNDATEVNYVGAVYDTPLHLPRLECGKRHGRVLHYSVFTFHTFVAFACSAQSLTIVKTSTVDRKTKKPHIVKKFSLSLNHLFTEVDGLHVPTQASKGCHLREQVP